MGDNFRRRGAPMAAIAVLNAGGLVMATSGSASASSLITAQTGAAVFNSTNLASGTVGVRDLWSGDQLLADCWSTGQNLGPGNIWYHTVDGCYVHLGGLELTVTGWTHAPYVDARAAANGSIPHC